MPVSKDNLYPIITDPDSAEVLVREADQLGRSLKEMGLATNQIRTLFGEVRQIQAQWSMGEQNDETTVRSSARRQTPRQLALRRLTLLKPKMAYRARRERGRAVEELVKVLDPALDLVIQEKDPEKQSANFTHFVQFFEAILAYHKSYGGN